MLSLKRIELNGFKSFANKTILDFSHSISAIVGPNGSGKSNIIEAMKWVVGDQSLKGLRVKKGEDLIFHGPNNSSLQNAIVSITFLPKTYQPQTERNPKYLKQSSDKNNTAINEEEIKISRLIQKNGVNKYFLDKSEMRLKDIIETLSLIKLSSSRHYIVNQGASDKILNASPVGKKMIIEGALGIDVYNAKILEFSKKIKQTEENIIKINDLRNEINPHLKFLQKQINKFKKSASLKEILKNKCAVYISKTDSFIQGVKEELAKQKIEPSQKLKNITQNLKNLEENLKNYHENQEKESRALGIKQIEEKLKICREKSLDYERQLGRAEGALETEKVNYKTGPAERKTDIEEKTAGGEIVFPPETDQPLTEKKQILKNFYDDISLKIKEILNLKNETNYLTKQIWTDIECLKETVERFFTFISDVNRQSSEKKESRALGIAEAAEVKFPQPDKYENLKKEKFFLEEEIKNVKTEESRLLKELEEIKNKIEERNKEIELFQEEKMALYRKLNIVKEILQKIEFEEMKINSKTEEFEKEKWDMLQFLDMTKNEALNIDKDASDKEFLEEKELFKIREEARKIRFKIEEIGEPDKETIEEYDTLAKRDELFEKELKDLTESLSSLAKLSYDLKEKLKKEFSEGLEKINDEFQKLFYKIFEGGKAVLKVISAKTNEEKEEKADFSLEESCGDLKKEDLKGIDIIINLPKKRVNSLDAFSGGERSLISVALLFAITSINPPPFLMLDETDAALDEINSRKYGMLLKEMSEKTQLIVITHNRETMKQAGTLYGITLGKDGISRLLSVKLDEVKD